MSRNDAEETSRKGREDRKGKGRKLNSPANLWLTHRLVSYFYERMILNLGVLGGLCVSLFF